MVIIRTVIFRVRHSTTLLNTIPNTVVAVVLRPRLIRRQCNKRVVLDAALLYSQTVTPRLYRAVVAIADMAAAAVYLRPR